MLDLGNNPLRTKYVLPLLKCWYFSSGRWLDHGSRVLVKRIGILRSCRDNSSLLILWGWGAFWEQGSSPSPDPNMLVPCSLVQSSKPGFEFSLGSSGTDLLSIAPHVYEIDYSGQPLSSHSILMSHTKAARQHVNTECSWIWFIDMNDL